MPIKVRQPIIVEGKYDRMRLAPLIDGVLIETGGFRVFKDKELLASLRHLAADTGIILMTDSDDAGFRIRNFIKSALGPNAKITHVFIPSVKGVEKRKDSPSAEGLLGVEGMDTQTLLEAFARAGVESEEINQKSELTAADLFAAGLTGKPDSAARRRKLLTRLKLPQRLSNRTMLTILCMMLTRSEFFELAALIDND